MTLLQTLPWKARKWFLPKFICASSKPWRCIPSQTVLPGWFCLNVLPYLLITQFKHLFHFFLFLSSSNKVIFKFYMFSFLLYGYIRPLLQAYTIFRAYPCIAHYPPSSYPFCFPIVHLIFSLMYKMIIICISGILLLYDICILSAIKLKISIFSNLWWKTTLAKFSLPMSIINNSYL